MSVDEYQKSSYLTRVDRLRPGLSENKGIDAMVDHIYDPSFEISDGFTIPNPLRGVVADSALHCVDRVIKLMNKYSNDSDEPDTKVSEALESIAPLLVGPASTLEGPVLDDYVEELCKYFVESNGEKPLDHLPSYLNRIERQSANQRVRIARLNKRYSNDVTKVDKRRSRNEKLAALAILTFGGLFAYYLVSSAKPEPSIPTIDPSGNPAIVCPVCPE